MERVEGGWEPISTCGYYVAVKFAFKLTGFLSALLRGLVSFQCRWWLGWQVWANPQFGFVLEKLLNSPFADKFALHQS
jgi:hypothetical protein